VDIEVENKTARNIVLTDNVVGVDQVGFAGRCRDAIVGGLRDGLK
jgi:hypothetical protein